MGYLLISVFCRLTACVSTQALPASKSKVAYLNHLLAKLKIDFDDATNATATAAADAAVPVLAAVPTALAVKWGERCIPGGHIHTAGFVAIKLGMGELFVSHESCSTLETVVNRLPINAVRTNGSSNNGSSNNGSSSMTGGTGSGGDSGDIVPNVEHCLQELLDAINHHEATLHKLDTEITVLRSKEMTKKRKKEIDSKNTERDGIVRDLKRWRTTLSSTAVVGGNEGEIEEE